MPSARKTVAPIEEKDGLLTDSESSFIMDTCLKPKHRKDENVLRFIEKFVQCKHVGEASAYAGVDYTLGYSYKNRIDISNCIQKIIDKSAIKYGLDATEIFERAKEIVDFDPILVQNPDGTFKDNLWDIEPSARRNIRKLKVQNLYSQSEDLNGIKNKIIIGKVIEYEFYDKMKGIDLVGREKDMFKTTTKHEHSLTQDMADILLASAKRGEDASKQITQQAVDVSYREVNDE